MIRARFYRSKRDKLVGFSIKGHAGLAEAGQDVCCASVSSAVMLVSNTLTEVFKIKADVSVLEEEIKLTLEEESDLADKLLCGFLLHMDCLSEDFSGLINITISEV